MHKGVVFSRSILSTFLISFCFFTPALKSQPRTTGINNSNPNSKASLDVGVTSGHKQGLLMPRLSTADTNSIGVSLGKDKGMMFFDTLSGIVRFWNGSKWGILGVNNIATGTSTRYIGEPFGGGVIFELWKDNLGVEHGLIVSTNEQSTSATYSNLSSALIGLPAQSSWDGLSNSNAIVSQAGHTSSAAKLCLDLVSNGQSDWYLPAIDELNILYNNRYYVNKTLSTLTGASPISVTAYYWSSTEYIFGSGAYAWGFTFYGGTASDSFKYNTAFVRAIRAF